MNNTLKTRNWAIKTLVPEEVYTNRQSFLDYFHKAALEARHRRTMSTVLLGQRRMGKTEIFKRVVNRLFFEQDYRDPEAVIPVYYSFPDTFKDRWDFAAKYVENFIRWYAAFRLRDTELLSAQKCEYEELIETIRDNSNFSKNFKSTLKLLNGITKKGVIIPEQWALCQPRQVSDRDDSTIVMFLDEFQNTRLPQYDLDVVGYMQEAVESPTCPHFVTGSAMSILVREILGRGSLFGRFSSEPIEPLTGYWGTELTRNAAKYYKTIVTEEMAPVVANRCGGNPFYITAVIRQTTKQNQVISDEHTLNAMLAVDLSSGFIWDELSDQVNRWIERINEYGITKWVLYLSALEEGERIDLNHIQQQLWELDRQQVDISTIREVLIKLSRGDLIDYKKLGGWFKKVDDPILLEFLKVWGQIEVEGQNRNEVINELQKQYDHTKRQFHELAGYLAEVYMAQILLNARRQTLPGHYFHQTQEVKVPNFVYVSLRERLGASANSEIDVHGAAGVEQWVGESKWLQGRKVGVGDIKKLLKKAEMVQKNLDADILRVWFFGHDGFTKKAEALMQEKGVFWSTRTDLDELLEHVNLRRLPDLSSQ